jgi:hypothetical protein
MLFSMVLIYGIFRDDKEAARKAVEASESCSS